jgi:hypothetical protein
MEALFAHQLKISGAAGQRLSVSDTVYESLSAAGGEASEGELAIAHESAHAIETASAREKSLVWEATRLTYNTNRDAYKAAGATYDEVFAADDTGVGPEVKAAEGAMDRAEKAMDAAMAEHKKAQAVLNQVYNDSRLQSHRLMNFVQFVNSGGVKASLTVYAQSEWPHNPREFYADAYAYYVLNPERLKKHSQPLHDYFASGKHLNDNKPR